MITENNIILNAHCNCSPLYTKYVPEEKTLELKFYFPLFQFGKCRNKFLQVKVLCNFMSSDKVDSPQVFLATLRHECIF